MAQEAHGEKKHGIGGYIWIALILGAITYVEFYIIEYEVSFLGDGATLFWLMLLSVAKFILVIMYFMHLKGDDAAYSGFFASGMVIALGTFVAFSVLMTAPGSLALVRAQLAPEGKFLHGEAEDHGGGYDDHALPKDVEASIATDGYSRDLVTVLGDGRPKDQTWSVTPPAAADGGWTLTALVASTASVAEAAPVPTTADSAEVTTAPASDVAAWDEAMGASTYAANCAGCHQATGAGIPGVFPPLAGHAPNLVAPDGGREYLLHVLAYGLQGAIVVNGATYQGLMPAWPALTDEQIAAVANYVVHAWDNDQALDATFEPFTADEAAAVRATPESPTQVYERRQALGLP